jgi:hypothetical protein
MKTYSVDFSWDETVTVDADNKKDAIEKIKKIMEDEALHPDMDKSKKDMEQEIEDNILEIELDEDDLKELADVDAEDDEDELEEAEDDDKEEEEDEKEIDEDENTAGSLGADDEV